MTNNKKMFSFIIILFTVLAGVTGGLIYFAYNITMFTTYSENTTIANLYVGGLFGDEAKKLIVNETTTWDKDAKVKLVFQNYEILLNNDEFNFDTEKSYNSLKNGTNNRLYVDYKNPDYIKGILEADSYLNTINFDVDKIKRDVLNHVALLKYDINFDIGKQAYLLDYETTRKALNTVHIDNVENAIYIQSLIDEIEIKSKQFSMIDFLNNHLQTETALTNEDYSVIASGVYQLILNTNFNSINKHIGSVPPSYINRFGYFGYEALINLESNKDLTFYNPNSYSYFITISNVSSNPNRLTFTLEGLPFVDTITSSNSNYEELTPKEIVMYTDACSYVPFTGDSKVCPGATMGSRTYVTRTVRDYKGIITTVVISEDIYMPIDKIIVKKQTTTTSK